MITNWHGSQEATAPIAARNGWVSPAFVAVNTFTRMVADFFEMEAWSRDVGADGTAPDVGAAMQLGQQRVPRGRPA